MRNGSLGTRFGRSVRQERAGSGETPPTRLRLVLPGILAERPRAQQFVAGACRAHELPRDVEEALVAALMEAFNHAVLYSYERSAGTVTVEIEIAAGQVTVQLRDRGAGFDAQGGDPETLSVRRYGLFIMLRAMDEVRWRQEGDENVVVMVKRIPNG